MEYCSSAEGTKFQKLAIEFDKEIRELGRCKLQSKAINSSKK